MTSFTYGTPDRRATEEVTVEVAVTDAPARPLGTGAKQRFRPDTLTITWRRDRRSDDTWSPWQPRVVASGPKLRVDGTLWPTGARYDDRWTQHSTEWVEAIAATRPPAGSS